MLVRLNLAISGRKHKKGVESICDDFRVFHEKTFYLYVFSINFVNFQQVHRAEIMPLKLIVILQGKPLVFRGKCAGKKAFIQKRNEMPPDIVIVPNNLVDR